MKKTQLGEFEEIVLLTIAVLHTEAYGVSIKNELESRLGYGTSVGALQTALKRLEEKGYLDSAWGEASNVRGGKRKKYYTITASAKKALQEIKDIRAQLWSEIPSMVLKFA
jgi:PadR family transcriptional regulator, regulatory protein PadR